MPRVFDPAGSSKLVMRSLYIDQADDDELRLIAHRYNVSKSDLIRKMINRKLQELRAGRNDDSLGTVNTDVLKEILPEISSSDEAA